MTELAADRAAGDKPRVKVLYAASNSVRVLITSLMKPRPLPRNEAGCCRPIAKYNSRYAVICAELKDCEHIDIPAINPRVSPVSDSLQFNLQDMSPAQVDAFLAACKRRGMPVGLFGSKENARNYENWRYSPAAAPLPFTKALIAAAIDVRLPAEFN